MASTADILASLDRALAEAGSCKIATKPEALPAAQPHAAPDVEADPGKPSLVAIQHPTPSPLQSTPTNVTTSLSKPLQEAKAQAETFLTLPWRKLWRHQKLARAFIAAEEAGGISFTLNLSGRLQNTLGRSADPVRYLSHRINQELKALGVAIPYAFTFEVSSAGRLHVHGVMIPASFDEDHVLAIDRALARAGGRLQAHRVVQASQSYLGTLPDGLGWFAYLQKSGDDAARFLGTDKVTFISTALRKLCA